MRRRYSESDKQDALELTIRRLERLSIPFAQEAANIMTRWRGRKDVDWTSAAIEVHRFRSQRSLFGHDATWAFLPFGMRANDIYCRVPEVI